MFYYLSQPALAERGFCLTLESKLTETCPHIEKHDYSHDKNQEQRCSIFFLLFNGSSHEVGQTASAPSSLQISFLQRILVVIKKIQMAGCFLKIVSENSKLSNFIDPNGHGQAHGNIWQASKNWHNCQFGFKETSDRTRTGWKFEKSPLYKQTIRSLSVSHRE